jgi:hypothetical protein
MPGKRCAWSGRTRVALDPVGGNELPTAPVPTVGEQQAEPRVVTQHGVEAALPPSCAVSRFLPCTGTYSRRPAAGRSPSSSRGAVLLRSRIRYGEVQRGMPTALIAIVSSTWSP